MDRQSTPQTPDPASGSRTPSALGIFSFHRNGVTVSESGVRADRPSTALLNQISGFDVLPLPFQGLLRVNTSSPAGVTVVGRSNEDGDFLIASTPAIDENAPAAGGQLLFPQFADGGGYTTQLILFNPASAASTGTLQLFSASGFPVDLGLR